MDLSNLINLIIQLIKNQEFETSPFVLIKPYWWSFSQCRNIHNQIKQRVNFILFLDESIALLHRFDMNSGITILQQEEQIVVSLVIKDNIKKIIEVKYLLTCNIYF
eukprot:TRINITY_DN5972_c0_g1_i6.p1 TRINITY_DN5972_c0_g1~~TRINITY_DN5972_c0_g1_i6.p1  ORF type:complete len:106 (+),score=20.87 TRINITY_DN5972_c0_g1_i6:358-675(+)